MIALDLSLGIGKNARRSGTASPTNVILTEANQFLITEAGEFLKINIAPFLATEASEIFLTEASEQIQT